MQVGCVSTYVQEVLCRKRLNRKFIERSRCMLSDLINQARMENKNGILMQYSPDKSFDKFLQLSSSLPESARAWPVQLC